MHDITSPSFRALAFAVCVLSLRGTALHAQQQPPQPPASPQPPLAPYRAPVIALVQPPAGGAVPQDKPVVVLRFAQGEADDPIDSKSFTVAVDGKDVTSAFHVVSGEAWGALAPSQQSADATLLAPGNHELNARVCSERGACAMTQAMISVIPVAAPAAAGAPATGRSLHQRILDAALNAARRILVP